MKKLFWKIYAMAAVIAAVLIVNFALAETPSNDTRSITAASTSGTHTLIIDAGHGGVDGGAVSDGGTLESGINLDIAQKLDLLMGFFGVNTIMTRDSETITYSEKAGTIREKKMEDIKNRVNTVNSAENAVLISIHQNKYTSGGPFGAQVLFSKTTGSEEFAKSMQGILIGALNPKNYRTAAQISDNIYLMNNVKCTAILIECGFLSNKTEEALLNTSEYRLKVAAAIAAGYLTNFG